MTDSKAYRLTWGFDPPSWLVHADWCEEQGRADEAALWRLRGEVGRALLPWVCRLSQARSTTKRKSGAVLGRLLQPVHDTPVYSGRGLCLRGRLRPKTLLLTLHAGVNLPVASYSLIWANREQPRYMKAQVVRVANAILCYGQSQGA